MDSIIVNDIRVEGRHGCGEGEQNHVQPFRVDVTVQADFSQATVSDRLEHTVDYRSIIKAATRVVRGESVNLLETLAERVAAEILPMRHVHRVLVRVTKLRPPIPDFDGTVSVEIERER